MKVAAHVAITAGTALLVFLFLEAFRANQAKEPIANAPVPGYDHV